MTGRLNNLTGSQQAADHERRIRELERRLRVSQADLPRRTAASGGPLVAYWNNSDGSMDASRYQEWNQHFTLGDTSWFSFPESGDVALILMQTPGIIRLIASASGDDQFELEMYAGDDNIVGSASSDAGQRVTVAGSAVFQGSEFGGFSSWPNIQVKTPGAATVVNATLSVAYWAGEPTFSAH